MMLECIPNFSEGRDETVVQAIAKAAEGPKVRILGMEADPDHHRSVLTAVGSPDMLAEAIFRSVQVAVEKIDMRAHRGTHPRIGAVDVVPFVPLAGTTMDVAVRLARDLGCRIADELALPVYFYEEAALAEGRHNLADVRRGQFEGLRERLVKDPPDRGPKRPHPTAGAVAVGARKPLIAFNVYLNTRDIHVARRVARAVRGSSGGLVGVKALAMDTRRKEGVQVSMNLVDYPKTRLPEALEMVRREACRQGVAVSGTELVGFMPFEAIEDMAHYYLGLAHFDRRRILEVALQEALGEDGI